MNTTTSRAVTVTIPNPTAAQMIAITELLEAAEQNETATTPATTKRAGKRTKPETTVNEDEDEEFGTKTLTGSDLEDTDDEENEDEETDEETDEDDGISFEEVKAALNKYGHKNPDGAKAILLSFNMKSTKELEKHKGKYEAVYRKVMAKLKKK